MPDQQWSIEEDLSMDLITSTVPDQIFNHVKNNTTTMAMWTAIKAIYQTCSKMATINLTQKLQSTKLQDKGDVRAHLTNLMNM
jgi:hypothetical protein